MKKLLLLLLIPFLSFGQELKLSVLFDTIPDDIVINSNIHLSENHAITIFTYDCSEDARGNINCYSGIAFFERGEEKWAGHYDWKLLKVTKFKKDNKFDLSLYGAHLTIYKTRKSYVVEFENYWGPHQGNSEGCYMFYSLEPDNLFTLVEDLSFSYYSPMMDEESCYDVNNSSISCVEIRKIRNVLPKVVTINGERPNLKYGGSY